MTFIAKFKMPIGDWSYDGHGSCFDFTVECTPTTIGYIRDVHFNIEKITGINIGEVCSEYEDATVSGEVLQKIKDTGFKSGGEDLPEVEWYPSAEELAELWCFLLNKVNPDLNATIIPDTIPSIVFYGVDELGRHINAPGYGLFGD